MWKQTPRQQRFIANEIAVISEQVSLNGVALFGVAVLVLGNAVLLLLLTFGDSLFNPNRVLLMGVVFNQLFGLVVLVGIRRRYSVHRPYEVE